MRTWAKGSRTAILAVSLVALGAGPAMSGTAHADTSGNGSVGGGNQVNLPVSIPIDISGNAVGAAGKSTASSEGGASVTNSRKGNGNKTSGNSSILGGNQVTAPISAPINACGNAVSLFGSADAGCKGGAKVKNKGGKGGGNSTNGDNSLLGGNQVTAPISAPINACGNAVALFGKSSAGCKGGSKVENSGGNGAGGDKTSGKSSVAGGNQITAPIAAPVNICGNAVALLGEAFAGCKGGAKVDNGNGGGSYGRSHTSGSGNSTSGMFGAGSGNQLTAPVGLPINVCGNGGGNVAPVGCKGGSEVNNKGGSSGNRTSGKYGALSGNQVTAPISAPVNICGNAAAVLGEAFAGCKGGAKVKSTGMAGGNTTSGQSGVGAGNQVTAPISAPINACGNAVAALGLSEAECKGGAKVKPQGSGGGNTTSGKSSVLGGNQADAPVSAPINACGNAAAVLGDAVAGCLGGSKVGQDHPEKGGHWDGRDYAAKSKQSGGGLLSSLPVAPGLPKLPIVGGLTDVAKVAQAKPSAGGAPSLPVIGQLPVAGALPVSALPLKKVNHAPKVKAPRTPAAPAPAGLLPAPVAGAAKSIPAVNMATGTAQGLVSTLPLPAPKLMSAEQPAGVAGMNSASLAVLAFGALLAGAVGLFGPARRIRTTRK